MKRLILIALLFTSFSLSSQETEQDLTEPKNNTDIYKAFWKKLYANGGWSLYCGFRFNQNGETEDKGRIQIERVYPLQWIIETLTCKNRLDCHQSESKKFKAIESDLHNIYPVWWEIQSTKFDSSYGELPGEEKRFEDCDFERSKNITEPREIARGNIARAIFYMHNHYGLPIKPELLKTLLKWNKEDLPSEQEIYRNNIIEKIQGNRNPFIDNPNLVNKLKIVKRTD